jgi:hypothetical protein
MERLPQVRRMVRPSVSLRYETQPDSSVSKQYLASSAGTDRSSPSPFCEFTAIPLNSSKFDVSDTCLNSTLVHSIQPWYL